MTKIRTELFYLDEIPKYNYILIRPNLSPIYLTEVECQQIDTILNKK
jgi:hypothetical protein